MTLLLLVVVFAQAPRCSAEATAHAAVASERAAVFDLPGAAARLQAAVKSGCADAEVPSIYVRGLLAAREAYRFGGSPESLAPVLEAIALLNAASRETNDLAMIAAFVLRAAAAAAQSERDTMSLFLEQAIQLESIRLSAGLPGAPVITAHESAGELWLQVHRYEDARRAYQRAVERLGPTRRITLGLARVAARLEDVPEACRQYRTLAAAWKVSGPEPQEMVEARRFLGEPGCISGGT